MGLLSTSLLLCVYASLSHSPFLHLHCLLGLPFGNLHSPGPIYLLQHPYSFAISLSHSQPILKVSYRSPSLQNHGEQGRGGPIWINRKIEEVERHTPHEAHVWGGVQQGRGGGLAPQHVPGSIWNPIILWPSIIAPSLPLLARGSFV